MNYLTRRLWRLTWVAALLFMLAFAVVGCYSSDGEKNVTAEKAKSAVSSESKDEPEKRSKNSFAGNSPEERRDYFAKAITKFKDYQKPEAIQAEIPFKLKVPHSESLPPNPMIIKIPKGGDEVEVDIIYGDIVDDMAFYATSRKTAPDFRNDIPMMSSANPQLMLVHGRQAMAWEPYQDSADITIPGRVVWWEDGALYEMRGSSGSNPTSLETLLNLAESVR